MSAATTSVPALDNTLGALLLGALLATALWGISTMQTYEYYSTYSKEDPPWIQLMVAFVYFCDTVHEFMLCHFIYTYTVTHFGDFVYLGDVVWSILVMVLFSLMVSFVVHMFLTYRVWILSKRKPPVYRYLVTGFILCLVIGELVVSVAYFAEAWSRGTYVRIALELNVLSRCINAFGAAGDVAITVALIYLLGDSKSGMGRTDAIVTKLITFCLTTGLATSVDAILSLISISVWPDTFIYITFYCVIARLYSNSLMATLNARQRLKGVSDNSSRSYPGAIHVGRPTQFSHIQGLTESNEHTITIKTEVQTEIHRDESEDFIEMDRFKHQHQAV